MATSRIRLYNIPDLLEGNNYIVETIKTFLSQYTPQVDNKKFQFQRLESVKSIKLDLSQVLDTPAPSYMFNYCRIDRTADNGDDIQGEAPAFYYVEAVTQESKSTIRVDLKLDVLNTFFDQWKEQMTPATYIARGHEDRFIPFKAGTDLELVSIFNRIGEGDNFPLKEDESARTIIRQESKGDTAANPLKFYLIYRTAEDGRPCIDLAANRELLISAASTGGAAVEFDDADLVGGRYYYLLGEFSFQYYYERDIGGGSVVPTWSSEIHIANGLLQYRKDGSGNILIVSLDSNSSANYTADLGKIRITQGRKIYYSSTATLLSSEIEHFNYSTINAGDYSAEYLGSVDQLDKTSANLVKVIECPYCPIQYSYNSTTGVYSFNADIFNDKSELEYPKFLRTYSVGSELPKVVIGYTRAHWPCLAQTYAAATISALATTPARPFLNDPKIYTSPYFAYTLVYDSFAKQIKLENYEHDGTSLYGAEDMAFYYKQSANISSSLMFEAKTYTEDNPGEHGFVLAVSEESYPRILAANRNNEVALFSSSYLDYLKNGFNYEKKKLQENIAFSGAMAGLQTIGAALSFALSGVTGGVSAAAGAGLAVGAATTFANMGMSAHQGTEELEHKINLLKAQNFAVSGVDDLDLFNEYGKNKMQLLLYKLRPNDENRIRARFQYFGYAVDKYGNPYPGYFNSRHNFNYLKCDPVFKQPATTAIPQEHLDEIAEKLRAGVTIWHYRFYAYNNYRLDRDFENIEESALAALN